jgi:hypothetical protein
VEQCSCGGKHREKQLRKEVSGETKTNKQKLVKLKGFNRYIIGLLGWLLPLLALHSAHVLRKPVHFNFLLERGKCFKDVRIVVEIARVVLVLLKTDSKVS